VFFLFVQAPKEAPFIFENTFNYCISVILVLLVGFITGSQAALRHILFKADIVAAVLALILVFFVKSSDLLAPLGVLSSSYDKHNFFLLSLFLSIVILIGCFIGIVVSFSWRMIEDLFIKGFKYFSQQKIIKDIRCFISGVISFCYRKIKAFISFLGRNIKDWFIKCFNYFSQQKIIKDIKCFISEVISFCYRKIKDLFIKCFNYFSQQITIKKASTFLTDEPLKQEDSEVDKPAIDCILKKLKGTKTTSQAFAIGITGAWGSGKTSFANSLSRRLNETNSLWFEPWKFRGVANVQDSLFNELIDHFKKNDKYDLAFDTEAYERLLNHDEIPVYLKFLFNFLKLFKNDSETDIQEKFKKSLSDEKIYIFIDDLDRLDAAEILEVFKLVRSTLSISNLVYILIYDKAHIQSVLEKEVTEGNAKNFLDKIIQTEYHIPSKGLMSDYFIESFAKDFAENENFSDYEKAVIEVLVANLKDGLSSGTTTGGHSIFTKETYNFETIFNSHIFTIRDLKRLVNNFLLTSNTIRRDNWQVLFNQTQDLKTKKYEIYFQFLLEILKAKYPDIYDKLYFSDPNWKISADNLSISNIKMLDPAKELINSFSLPAENAAIATDEYLKILNKESFKKLFSELFVRHLFPYDVQKKLGLDLKEPNGIKDLKDKINTDDGSSFTFQNDSKGNQHKVILDDDPTKVETISHENVYGAVAYIYRFEQFAKENGFLCHQDHYDKYFKPSDAK
jgi:shikimate kinase